MSVARAPHPLETGNDVDAKTTKDKKLTSFFCTLVNRDKQLDSFLLNFDILTIEIILNIDHIFFDYIVTN